MASPRVDHEVEQGVLELPAIDVDRRRAGDQVELQGDRIAGAVLDQVAHLLDHLVERHVLGLQRLAARERQQAPREPGRAGRRATHALPLHAGAAVLVDRGLEQRQVAEDRAQVVVEVVRDAAGELPQHFELLGLQKRFLHLLQLLGGVPALGDVPGDLGEADEVAQLVADGVPR